MTRPLCPECNQRPRAVAYHKPNGIQYRKLCESCIKRIKKLPIPTPSWQLAGYQKKATCDRCGFRAKYSKQLLVYYIDGNLHNNNARNLKTICLNCTIEIEKLDLPWKPSNLKSDL